MTVANSLDPLKLPLTGLRLIEASAGTGKTYTIAALYIRLILGHDNESNPNARELFPPDILVVTFTEAAAKELRDRIRTRLSEAARYFSQQCEKGDAFLIRLRDSYPTYQWPACAHRLKLAADWMDESAIYTIHGWCHRMLQQHAFDSGNLFQQEVNNNDLELLNNVVRDYWRIHFYPLSEVQCLAIYQLAKSPDDLIQLLKPLLSEMVAVIPAEEDITDCLKQWEKWELDRRSLEFNARQGWQDHRQIVEDRLNTALENRWLNGNQYRPDSMRDKLAVLADWADAGATLDIDFLKKFGKESLQMGLVKAHQDKADFFHHAAFSAIDNLVSHFHQDSDIGKPLRLHALNWIKKRYDRAKQRAARITFDDMLVRLDKALQSESGQSLAQMIRQQYPVALFDEFQDTDPIQYRIISTLYPRQSECELGCFMIGDPKQAIYSFRGADIFTYLNAHRATVGQHYTLGVNYRATKTLIEAVNQIFSAADTQAEGAFRFKTEQDNPLSFKPVTANGRQEEWVIDNQLAPALTLWHWESDTPIGMPAYREKLAQITASEIVRLLNLRQQGHSGFRSQSGEIKSLQPSDIAILVRTGKEARIMRYALASRQLRSVYLSERDSIYATPEAEDLLLWLKAMADPRDQRKVCTALSTATIGWDYRVLQQLTQDEANWDKHLERFLDYYERWQETGILPTIRQLINDYGLQAKIQANPEGERCLTNLLHLSELLQQASSQCEGKSAIIRHLAEEISASDQSNEENVIRLESDADLIKIVTIHKAKGLEYPLVFLPFICGFREVSKRDTDYYRYHDVNHQLCLDLDQTELTREISDNERHQEDIRLLYVALTRAQFACWLGIAPIKSGNYKVCQLEKSAMGYLLGWKTGEPASGLSNLLSKLKGDCHAIAIQPLPALHDDLYIQAEQRDELSLPRSSTAKITDNWWIASYSSLQKAPSQFSLNDSVIRVSEPETAQEDKRADEIELSFNSASGSLSGIHGLPRGAGAGVLIHTLLEQCGHAGFETMRLSADLREAKISHLFRHHTWDDKREIVATALTKWLTMSLLDDVDVSLSSLAPGNFQTEMEFLLGVEKLDVTALDQWVSTYLFPRQSRPHLMSTRLHGFLKGFMDLVFLHNQKYYVADYKFNALGNNDEAYTGKTLEAAMLERRYDMQSSLYLLALHRLLKIRLGDSYDYDVHIGGSIYLFLRGVHGPSCGRVFYKPSRIFIEGLDALFGSNSSQDCI